MMETCELRRDPTTFEHVSQSGYVKRRPVQIRPHHRPVATCTALPISAGGFKHRHVRDFTTDCHNVGAMKVTRASYVTAKPTLLVV